MAIDPRQLRPTELVRLLNSTPLGEVMGERQLLRHRSRAGFRIGDDRHVDLFRYVAWLVQIRHEPQPESDGDPYGSMQERARARNAALSLAGRDIGELPPVVNPGAQGTGGDRLPLLLRGLFPVHLPPGLVARPPEGDRQDRAGRARGRVYSRWPCLVAAAKRASANVPAFGPSSTAIVNSCA